MKLKRPSYMFAFFPSSTRKKCEHLITNCCVCVTASSCLQRLPSVNSDDEKLELSQEQLQHTIIFIIFVCFNCNAMKWPELTLQLFLIVLFFNCFIYQKAKIIFRSFHFFCNIIFGGFLNIPGMILWIIEEPNLK